MEQVATSRWAAGGRAEPDAARRLASARRRLFLASSLAGLVVPWALWASGTARFLWWHALALLPLGPWGSLGGYVLLLLGGLALAQVPFSWLGYRLSRAFGLSRQSPRAWFGDWLKASGLSLVFGGAAALALYASLTLAGPNWWWVYATAASAVLVAITFVAPYVLVPIFYRMRPLEDDAVVDVIRRLSIAAGAEVRQVCTLDFSRKTVEANAAVIGLGRSRRVVLADTLLSEFTLPEVRSVVAHELGHHVHGDLLRLLALQAGLVWAGLGLAQAMGGSLLAGLGAIGGLAEPSNLPLLLLGAELYGLVSLPLANAISRRREAAADRFALQLTPEAGAFASALRKLAAQNLAELQPPRWAELVLYSHPPLGRRIQAAEALARAEVV